MGGPRRFTSVTASEAAKKGAAASAISRRRKADLRKAANLILANSVVDYDGQNLTCEEAVVMAMVEKALRGDVNAYKALLGTLGVDGRNEMDDKEQKARIQKLAAEAEAKLKPGGDALRVVIVDDIPPDAPVASEDGGAPEDKTPGNEEDGTE